MRSTDGPRFCSDAARWRGDDNAATAARVDVWILVELPQPWGVNPIRDAVLPDGVRNRLLVTLQEIPRSRVLFIRRRHETSDTSRIYVARTNPRPAVAMSALPTIDDVADVSFESLLEEAREPELPIVLVCTHGQHDSCCGRRGYPLYDALRQRTDLDVWQCSHIGGDRFAANALVLPWGLFYGPVEPAEADRLATSVLSDEIFLSAYRGRSSMSRPVQAAETFIRRARSLPRRTALRFTGRENLAEGQFRIQFREEASGILHDVTIGLYVASEAAYATCTSSTPGEIRQFRLLEHTVHN